jgi:GDP-L-fucose synthase
VTAAAAATFAGRRVLVTGATGVIGRALVGLLVEAGARVRAASFHEPVDPHPDVEYVQGDLMSREPCATIVRGMQDAFHLAAVRGSVAVGRTHAADFLVNNLLLNTHVMEESRRAGVERYLFASSICVYAPAEVFFEDRAWDAPPHPSDAYAGWAKRVGELQAAAYREQYGWEQVAIVRPVNVYGPYDDFDPRTAQVVPALVARVLGGESPLRVWGDGSAVRDFLHCRDAARGMLQALGQGAWGRPINLGSGVGHSIREVVDTILDATGRRPPVEWDTTRPTGERSRVADITRARSEFGFAPTVSLRQGIGETVEWFRANAGRERLRWTAFSR